MQTGQNYWRITGEMAKYIYKNSSLSRDIARYIFRNYQLPREIVLQITKRKALGLEGKLTE